MQHILNSETIPYQGQNESIVSLEPDWSQLSPRGQLTPPIAEAIAEKFETLRRFRSANNPDCTMPSQVRAPWKGARGALQQVRHREIESIVAHAGGLRQAFPLLVPPKPYCIDYLPGRMLIRPRNS